MDERLIVIGEDPGNRRNGLPLYPKPTGCAGDRLRRVLGYASDRTYLCDVVRLNLFAQKPRTWLHEEAEDRAQCLGPLLEGRQILLLGRRVQQAFGLDRNHEFYDAVIQRSPSAFTRDHRFRGRWVIPFPHPSGRSSILNDETQRAEANACYRIARFMMRADRDVDTTHLQSPTLVGLFDELQDRSMMPVAPARRLQDEVGWYVHAV